MWERIKTLAAVLALAILSTAASPLGSEVPKALREAAAKGNSPAQYALGSALEADGDFKGAEGWFAKAAASGYAGAQFKLGEFAEKGRVVEPNVGEALAWYEKAATQDFEPARQALEAIQRQKFDCLCHIGGQGKEGMTIILRSR